MRALREIAAIVMLGLCGYGGEALLWYGIVDPRALLGALACAVFGLALILNAERWLG